MENWSNKKCNNISSVDKWHNRRKNLPSSDIQTVFKQQNS